MRFIDLLRRLSLLMLTILFAVSSSGCLGCGGNPALVLPAPASALEQRFPDQAARVLEQGEAFLATGEGFALAGPSVPGAWQGGPVVLPSHGDEVIRSQGFGGVEVQVREIGALGAGVLVERAVAYRRAGGT